MQEMIDKIIERLEKKKESLIALSNSFFGSREDEASANGMEEAIKIVKEVADEYVPETNVEENGWIPCSENLPETFELVLIQNKYGVMSVASRVGNKWFNFQGTELWEAIAWQPLPKPYEPKGE